MNRVYSSAEFDVALREATRSYVVHWPGYQPGGHLYARAIARPVDEAISLVFETSTEPFEEWIRPQDPILPRQQEVIDDNTPSYNRGTKTARTPSAEMGQKIVDALDEEDAKVKRVLVNMKFGPFSEFFKPNSGDPMLVAIVADLCQKYFPSMDPAQSALIVEMGDEVVQLDELLQPGKELTDVMFMGKFPKPDGSFRCFKIR
ncbi:MAG: hypothetical protein JSS32_07570 [Verrucomicrobia bacterium]|nr:hypothetical protein [Verrucomicrobiota bacterium]